MSDPTPIDAARSAALELAAAAGAADVARVAALLAPSVAMTPGGAMAAHEAAALLVDRGRHRKVLTAVASHDRVALLVQSTEPDEWFEGLDIIAIDAGRVVGVMQLASAANGVPESATPPSPVRSPSGVDTGGLDANIALVQRFYIDTFGRGDVAALDELVTEDYLQHNPWVGPGRAGLAKLIAMTGAAPMEGLGNGGIFGEGDHVVHISKLPFGDEFILADLFRVEGSMLAEHWDFTPLGTALPIPPGAELGGPP
jgi:predicted SnoaL-like aldol condensation-catalyzing enzyme